MSLIIPTTSSLSLYTLQPRVGSSSSISPGEVQKLKTELLEMRLLYTTTIEDYEVV